MREFAHKHVKQNAARYRYIQMHTINETSLAHNSFNI